MAGAWTPFAKGKWYECSCCLKPTPWHDLKWDDDAYAIWCHECWTKLIEWNPGDWGHARLPWNFQALTLPLAPCEPPNPRASTKVAGWND